MEFSLFSFCMFQNPQPKWVTHLNYIKEEEEEKKGAAKEAHTKMSTKKEIKQINK